MTREEILSSIQSDLGTTQISERSINEMIDTFGLADNDGLTIDGLAPYSKFLKQTMTGNISSVVAGAVNEKNSQIAALQTQIAELKKQIPDLQVPNPDAEHGGSNADASMAEIGRLRDEIEALKNAQLERDAKAKISAIKSDVKSTLKSKLGEAKVVVNDFVLKTTIDGFEITKESKVSEAVKELEALYLENLKAAGLAGGYQPRGGGGQGNEEKSVTSDYFAKKKAKEGWGK